MTDTALYSFLLKKGRSIGLKVIIDSTPMSRPNRGDYYPNSRTIYLSEVFSSAERRNVILAHEIGHAQIETTTRNLPTIEIERRAWEAAESLILDAGFKLPRSFRRWKRAGLDSYQRSSRRAAT